MAESTTPKSTTTSSKTTTPEQAAEELVTTSSQAQHSSITEVKPENADEYPPPGVMHEEKRGTPS